MSFDSKLSTLRQLADVATSGVRLYQTVRGSKRSRDAVDSEVASSNDRSHTTRAGKKARLAKQFKPRLSDFIDQSYREFFFRYQDDGVHAAAVSDYAPILGRVDCPFGRQAVSYHPIATPTHLYNLLGRVLNDMGNTNKNRESHVYLAYTCEFLIKNWSGFDALCTIQRVRSRKAVPPQIAGAGTTSTVTVNPVGLANFLAYGGVSGSAAVSTTVLVNEGKADLTCVGQRFNHYQDWGEYYQVISSEDIILPPGQQISRVLKREYSNLDVGDLISYRNGGGGSGLTNSTDFHKWTDHFVIFFHGPVYEHVHNVDPALSRFTTGRPTLVILPITKWFVKLPVATTVNASNMIQDSNSGFRMFTQFLDVAEVAPKDVRNQADLISEVTPPTT